MKSWLHEEASNGPVLILMLGEWKLGCISIDFEWFLNEMLALHAGICFHVGWVQCWLGPQTNVLQCDVPLWFLVWPHARGIEWQCLLYLISYKVCVNTTESTSDTNTLARPFELTEVQPAVGSLAESCGAQLKRNIWTTIVEKLCRTSQTCFEEGHYFQWGCCLSSVRAYQCHFP